MSNIITKAHPCRICTALGIARRRCMAFCHRTDTVFYSLCAYTIPVKYRWYWQFRYCCFSALLYTVCLEGGPGRAATIDRLVALTTSVAFSVQCVQHFLPGLLAGHRAGTECLLLGLPPSSSPFPDPASLMEERARRVCVGGYLPIGRLAA